MGKNLETPIKTHLDKKKKQLVEAQNNADAMIYQTEKSLKDLGADKLDADTRANIESKIEALKKIKDSNDLEGIKKATEELAQASHKLAEAMYQKASQEGAQQTAGDAGGAHEHQTGGGKDDDDVIDADYESADK